MSDIGGLADVACAVRFTRCAVYIWDIRVPLLFIASFLQESALLHGWIEHALLPPDYMDLSGIFINSSAAARVCTTLQTTNAAHNSRRDTDLSRETRKGGTTGGGKGLPLCYRLFGTHKTDLSICVSSSTSLDDICVLRKAHADTHTNRLKAV